MNKTEIKIKKKVEGVANRFSPSLYRIFKNTINKRQIRPHILEPKIKLVDINELTLSSIESEEYEEIIQHYFNHEFDLLGSGWKSYNQTKRIGEYTKIAWNRDIQSGYVWDNANTDCFNYMYYPEGTDVKRVWELGRLQHLLRMALYALCHLEKSDEILREYKNQVIDFIEDNPIGVGVHWTCSMEVGIRAVNLILSNDIMCQLDSNNVLDKEFLHDLNLYILNHGTYICENQELVRRSSVGHNHYYANLLGLLYISAYYQKKTWWQYARDEFFSETLGQFSEDGSNFEGSTAYHALCTEMLILGTAIIGRIEKELPDSHIKMVEQSIRYLYDLTDDEGRIPQIGDNDSGQVIRITPVLNKCIKPKSLEKEFQCFEQENLNLREDLLNVNPIISKAEVFFRQDDSYPKREEFDTEASLIKAISNECSFEMNLPVCKYFQLEEFIPSEKYYEKTVFKGVDLTIGGNGWIYYKDAGMLIYKSKNANIFYNLGKRDDSRFTGHLHDDVLHCNITLNGKRVIEDPGTVTYTANKKVRNLLRSYEVHFVPVHENRADKYDTDVFSYKRNSCCEVVGCTLTSVTVRYTFDNVVHYRKITVTDKAIEIEDFSNCKFNIENKNENIFSDNYGSICIGE